MKFLSPQFPVTAAQGRNDMMTFSDDWVVASSTTQQSMDEIGCREVNGPRFLIKLDGQCGKNVIRDKHTHTALRDAISRTGKRNILPNSLLNKRSPSCHFLVASRQ